MGGSSGSSGRGRLFLRLQIGDRRSSPLKPASCQVPAASTPPASPFPFPFPSPSVEVGSARHRHRQSPSSSLPAPDLHSSSILSLLFFTLSRLPAAPFATITTCAIRHSLSAFNPPKGATSVHISLDAALTPPGPKPLDRARQNPEPRNTPTIHSSCRPCRPCTR